LPAGVSSSEKEKPGQRPVAIPITRGRAFQRVALLHSVHFLISWLCCRSFVLVGLYHCAPLSSCTASPWTLSLLLYLHHSPLELRILAIASYINLIQLYARCHRAQPQIRIPTPFSIRHKGPASANLNVAIAIISTQPHRRLLRLKSSDSNLIFDLRAYLSHRFWTPDRLSTI
jgi:hypothetical protein